MKRIKIMLALLLSAAICFGILPFGAFAEGGEQETAEAAERVAAETDESESASEEDENSCPTSQNDGEIEPEEGGDGDGEPEEALPYGWYAQEEEEYVISTVTELKEFAKLTQGDVTLDDETVIAQTDFSGKTVMLASDLDLEGLDWTEYMVMSFRGVFDGGNKTISNFSFSGAGVKAGFFFSIMDTGIVKDLKLTGIYAELSSSGSDKARLGALAYGSYGKLINCSVSDVNVSITGNCTWTAGLAGGIQAGGSAENCSVNGFRLTASGGTVAQTGGIVGTHQGTIQNCSANNIVIAGEAMNYVGGAVGYAKNAKVFSTEAENVTVTSASGALQYTAGSVGIFAGGEIAGSVASDVTISACGEKMDYVGGLVGIVEQANTVALIINPLIVAVTLRRNPYPLVFRCLRESGVTAFFTRSSAANIPVNMTLCEKLGLDRDMYSVSIPLGSTINMDGASVTITIMTLATAHTLGIEVAFPTAMILSFLSALAACGTSGVAGGSLLLIPMACSLFGIPDSVSMQVVGVGFIIGVVQDSMETAINSSGDVLFTATAEYAHWKRQGKRLPDFLGGKK